MPAIRQDRRVFQPGANAVAEGYRSTVDRPGRNVVAMVHLLERDSRAGDEPLDRCRVRNRDRWIGVERLDHDTHAPSTTGLDHQGLASESAGEVRAACNCLVLSTPI